MGTIKYSEKSDDGLIGNLEEMLQNIFKVWCTIGYPCISQTLLPGDRSRVGFDERQMGRHHQIWRLVLREVVDVVAAGAPDSDCSEFVIC